MEDELRFRGSLKKAITILLLSVAFVVAVLWIASVQQPVIGWLCVAFFGLGIPASLLMMRRASTYLRLDRSGFEIVAMYRRARFSWSEVTGFAVRTLRGNKVVAIGFSEGCGKQKVGRRWARARSGMEGAIPDHYAAPVEEICGTLNEWKARHDTSDRKYEGSTRTTESK